MSELREVMARLRAALDAELITICAWQRGNFTMVRLVHKEAGVEREGVGFSKRNTWWAPVIDKDGKRAAVQDQLDYERGMEIATGRAIKDLARQMVASEEAEDDVPF